MRIGDLARSTGASVRSLRYYEAQGLLASRRSPSGQRIFDPSDVERVIFVRRLLSAGISTTTIAQVLPCVDSPDDTATDSAWARLTSERAKLDAHIAELEAMRSSIDILIAENRRFRAAPGRPIGGSQQAFAEAARPS